GVPRLSVSAWRWLVLLLLLTIFSAIIYRWISLERLQRFAPPEVMRSPTPEPTPTRPPVITGRLETAKLFNGITLHSTVNTPPGTDAATERSDPQSYMLELTLRPDCRRLTRPLKSLPGAVHKRR